MAEVAGFWAGAVKVGRRVDLIALAKQAGGWEALSVAGRRELLAMGVALPLVEAWMSAPAYRTKGVVLTLADEGYPPALRRTRRPPPVLHVDGDPAALGLPGMGIVGTRRCTAYGRGVARQLGHLAASSGWSVVSGLARGVDGEAHRAAAEVGTTVAVLAHGLGHTAPPSHRGLRARILEQGGALVSVWPDDEEPRPWQFPVRNLWIAGLSEVVVVVEAGERSGALITARHALAEGRDVAAVPGPVGAASSKGCLDLLRDGAEVIADVRSFVEGRAGSTLPLRHAWLDEVCAGASIDAVARRYGRSAADVLAELTRLEVAGTVVRLPGRRYGLGRMAT